MPASLQFLNLSGVCGLELLLAAEAAAVVGDGVALAVVADDTLVTEFTRGACACLPFKLGDVNRYTVLPIGFAQNWRPS